MSKASSFFRPVRRATIAVAVTPPAGPDSTVCTGRSAALCALIRPPSDRTMCSGAPDAHLVQPVLDPRQVAGHDRPDVVVHHRGDGAVVLAELGQDVRGQRHRQCRGNRSATSCAQRAARAPDWRRSASARSSAPRFPTRKDRRSGRSPEPRRVASDTSPRAFIRSEMPRVSRSAASGSGFSITIQPNSGPGVQDFARCSVCSNPGSPAARPGRPCPPAPRWSRPSCHAGPARCPTARCPPFRRSA